MRIPDRPHGAWAKGRLAHWMRLCAARPGTAKGLVKDAASWRYGKNGVALNVPAEQAGGARGILFTEATWKHPTTPIPVRRRY